MGGTRAADRAHRRPAPGAARGGRRTGDRSDQALWQRGQVVRGGGHPRPQPEHRHPPPRARVPRLLDRRWRAPRARAPQLLPARAARARLGGARGGRLGGPPRRQALDGAARTLERTALGRRACPGRADRRRAPRGDRVRTHRRADRGAGHAPRRSDRLAPTRRADLRREMRRARPFPRGRSLRRAPPHRGVRARARARSRASRGRHAHVKASSRICRAVITDRDRSAWRVARAYEDSGAGARGGGRADPRCARLCRGDARHDAGPRLARGLARCGRQGLAGRAGRARRVRGETACDA